MGDRRDSKSANSRRTYSSDAAGVYFTPSIGSAHSRSTLSLTTQPNDSPVSGSTGMLTAVISLYFGHLPLVSGHVVANRLDHACTVFDLAP